MKNIILIILVSTFAFLQSCKDPSTVQVKNHVNQVKIQEVYWGDNYIASELLPGESSDQHRMDYIEDLPVSYKLSFKMTANDKTIYLETKEKYELDREQELIITISDETEVTNPNN